MNTTTTAPPFIPFASYRFTLLDGAVVVAGLLEIIVFVLAILAAVDHVSNEGRGGRKKRGKQHQPQCGHTQEEVIRSPIEVTSPDTAVGEGLQRYAIDTAGGATRAIPQYIQGDIEHHVIDTTLDSSDTTEVFFGESRIPSSNFVTKRHGHLCLSADGSTWADIGSNNGDYEDDNVFVDQENSSLQETTVRLSTFMPTDNTSVTETRGSILEQHVNPAFVPDDRESIDSGRSSKHESELSEFRPNEQMLLAEVHRYQGNSVVQHVELSVDTGLPVTKEDLLPTTGQLRRNSSAYKSTVNNPPGSYYFADRQSFTAASRTCSMNARYMERRVSQSHSQGSSSFRWVDMGEEFQYRNVVDDYEGTEMCVDTGRTLSEEDLHDQAMKTDPIRYETNHEVFGTSNPPRSTQRRVQNRPNMTDVGETSSRFVDDDRHKERIERPYSGRPSRMEEVVNGQNRNDHAMDGNYRSDRNSNYRGNNSTHKQTKPIASQHMARSSAKQEEQIRAYAITKSASGPYENLPEAKISVSPVGTNVADATWPPGESVPSQVRNVANSDVEPYENLPQAYREVTNANAPTSRPYENLPQTHDEVNSTNAPYPQIHLVHIGRGFGPQPSNSAETHDIQGTMVFTTRPTADIPQKQRNVQRSTPVLRQYENLPNTRDSVQSKISELRPYENLPETQGDISSYRHRPMPDENLHQADTRFKVDDISSSGPYETLPPPRGGVEAPGVQDNSIQSKNHDLKRNAGSERGSYRQALAGRFEDKTNKKTLRAKSISKAKKAKTPDPQTSQIATKRKHPEESTTNTQTRGEAGKVSNIQVYENHIQVRGDTPGVSESDMGQYVRLRQPESKEETHWTRASYQPRLTDGISEPDTSIPVVGTVQKSNTFTFSPCSGQSHEMPRTEGADMQVTSFIVAKDKQEIMV